MRGVGQAIGRESTPSIVAYVFGMVVVADSDKFGINASAMSVGVFGASSCMPEGPYDPDIGSWHCV